MIARRHGPPASRRKGARFTAPARPQAAAPGGRALPREADAMHDAGRDQLCIDTMRALPMEQVERAISGRPAVIAAVERSYWLTEAMRNSEGA